MELFRILPSSMQAEKKKIKFMTLKEIFENKEFIKYRQRQLDKSDKNYFLRRLKKGRRVIDVLPYLRTVNRVPIEFLQPILNETILFYDDISLKKRWMGTINRLFTPEKVQEAILNKISKSENLNLKCRAAEILYWTDVLIKSNGVDEKGNPIWKCGVEYFWNGSQFEKKCAEDNLNYYIQRRKYFQINRIRKLSKEFQKSKNIIFKYFLSWYLPKDINEYPIEIRENSIGIVDEISNQDFPNGADSLVKLINGNSSLEKLLFEELKWQKK